MVGSPPGLSRDPRFRRWRRLRLLSSLLYSLALAAASVADAEPRLTFVDLQPSGNQKLSAPLTVDDADGNSLDPVPRGEQEMAGTRFRIGEKMIHLRSKHAADLPEKVEGIKLDAAFDRLSILHSTGYGEGQMIKVEDGTEIGAYVVHYADKSRVRVPIRYGEDLLDWWDWPDRTELKRVKVAWTGTNPASERNDRKIRLFARTRENPHPETKVTAIDFKSNVTDCDPFLIALTLEKKDN
jgi:hypothetical protein